MQHPHTNGLRSPHEHESSGKRTEASWLSGIAELASDRTPDSITRMMATAREALGMDVAFVSKFAEDRMEFRALEGDAESFGCSEHLRGRQDPARPHYESQALPRHVEPEGIVVRGYEWFLGLPVAFVLTVMWVAGVALLGLCALTLHLLGDLLLQFLSQ